jgi:hypothetical protein
MRRRVMAFGIVFLAGVAGFALAQESTTGTLSGQVVDAQNAPLPGAIVTLTSSQGSKSLTTDASGKFFAPYLTLGKYSVKVELAGFTPVEQQNIEVRLGKRLDLAFALKVGDVHEVIEVVGEAPVVDTTSTSIGGNLLTDVLKRLPVGRNFTDTLYLVPGVSDSSGVGRANPSIGGASGLDNAYVVDGVNITDEGYGGVGVYSIVFGSLGSGVTTDFIKETQVKTGGFEAEYGMATGGVVNVVTESGTNAFHGGVFGYMRPSKFESSYKQLNTPFGTVNTVDTQQADFGVTLGGPIIKDKMFAFGVFNPQFSRGTYTAPAGFPLASLGNVDRNRHTYSYAAKLTYQLNANHRLDVSAFGDPSKGDNGPQRLSSLIGNNTNAFSALDYGGQNEVLKYDGILSRNWLIEATVSHSKNHFTELPSTNTWNITDGTVSPATITGGIGSYFDTDNHRYDFQLKSTNLFDAGGSHQLRYGVDYEDMTYSVANQITGPTFVLANGQATVTGGDINILPDPVFGKIYNVIRANTQNLHSVPQQYLSAFLQDTWQIGRLTLRPGVRYERQKLSGNPPLCHANDTQIGLFDGSGALVPCSFTFDSNFAPRIGATYDFTGKGKSKLYGAFSRFYVRIPNDLAARSFSADAGITRADYFDANLTQPIPNGVLAGGQTVHLITAGVNIDIVDPKAKLTYSQELLGGVELAVGQGVNLGVRYVHRTIPRILEDSANAAVVGYYTGALPPQVNYILTNVSANNPAIPALPGLTPGIMGEDPNHRYDAVEVTANKTFSHNWSLLASYRWSKLRGNFEGFFRSDNGQSDPGITSLFDFPINDPSYTAIGVPQFGFQGDIRYQGCTLGCGVLPNDRTHQFKVYGNYTWKDLNMAAGVNAGTGRALTGLWSNPVYGNSGEIPDSVRGSGILTTDGFLKRTPFEFTVDARLDYTFKINKSQRLILAADIFNLLNNQKPTWYDVYHDLAFGIPNPNFGQPVDGGNAIVPAYHVPRQVRVGARFEW